jgi:hypothetical protein
VGNPDASAARLRYCSRLKPTTFRLVLPHTTRPLAGAPITVGFCPTRYIGSNLYVSPILAAPLPGSVKATQSSQERAALTESERRPAASGSYRRPQLCRTSQLRIRTIHSSAGLGKAGAYIAFTNESRIACELAGWPRLVAITTAGKALAGRDVPPSAFPATTAKAPAPIVKLSPGRRADAAFLAADGAATRCPPSYRWLRVTPPANTKSVLVSAWVQYLGAYLPDCSAIAISPIVPAAYLQGG